MRLGMRGWPRTVKVGYKREREERGRHPSGLREILVTRPGDLEKVDPKSQIVKISHTVGERKRVAIMERAQALELAVANPGLKKPETAPAEELVVEEPEPTKAEKKAKTAEGNDE